MGNRTSYGVQARAVADAAINGSASESVNVTLFILVFMRFSDSGAKNESLIAFARYAIGIKFGRKCLLLRSHVDVKICCNHPTRAKCGSGGCIAYLLKPMPVVGPPE